MDRNFSCIKGRYPTFRSPSTRRAWIEILTAADMAVNLPMSPSTRRAWIEIKQSKRAQRPSVSPSTRRAWIEILRLPKTKRHRESPSTRRAWIEITVSPVQVDVQNVALHPEGVDRNPNLYDIPLDPEVALHPEGVDRNEVLPPPYNYDNASPSTRRAWIEITMNIKREARTQVALHPEGVDRNYTAGVYGWNADGRPPPGGRG